MKDNYIWYVFSYIDYIRYNKVPTNIDSNFLSFLKRYKKLSLSLSRDKDYRMEYSLKNNNDISNLNWVAYIDRNNFLDKHKKNILDINVKLKEFINNSIFFKDKEILLDFLNIYFNNQITLGWNYDISSWKVNYNLINYTSLFNPVNDVFIRKYLKSSCLYKLTSKYLICINFSPDQINSFKLYRMYDDISYPNSYFLDLIKSIFPKFNSKGFHILTRISMNWVLLGKKILIHTIHPPYLFIDNYNLNKFVKLWFNEEIVTKLIWVRIISFRFENGNIEIYWDLKK